MHKNTILITGVAGFIGMHTAEHFLSAGFHVVGIDNMNDYYDVSLKEDRLRRLKNSPLFIFHQVDISDQFAIDKIFADDKPDVVINLAAQAGVRYSIENPQTYVKSNVLGFVNVAESCVKHGVKHLVYASSSSVYGNSVDIPFNETQDTKSPVSVYAATKACNELLANVYTHQYNLKCSGLRFFTVYGPWGRPDMAPMLFAKSISEGSPLTLFNGGDHERDFTYIDDIVSGIASIVNQPESLRRPLSRVYNIGASSPVHLRKFLSLMEEEIGKPAVVKNAPMQPGDVKTTYADVSLLMNESGYKPSIQIEKGVPLFVSWYMSYYEIA